MNNEKLKFNITLRSTHWDKIPEYNIYVNDDLVQSGACDSLSQIELYKDISEGHNELRIELTNKTNSDCVQNEDKTEILKDMMLHIDKIRIDNIDLEHIRHTCSRFVPADPNEHETLEECVDLGWNGTYILKFTSPFYIWLLENM